MLLSRTYRRLLHSIDNHGPRGTILRAFDRLTSKQPRNEIRDRPTQDVHPFDTAHNAHTSGYIPGEALASGSSSDLYTTAYYGISPSTLTEALRRFPRDPAPFSFVDLGCGKGRALLLAAQFPFQQIIGIELSSDLCEVAMRNTASDPRIEIRQQDAITASYPDAPLILYLYHPFLAAGLRRMLANLERQFLRNPRDIYLLNANPGYPKVMKRFDFLKPVWDHKLLLSDEDAAADRHGITFERFTLTHASPRSSHGKP